MYVVGLTSSCNIVSAKKSILVHECIILFSLTCFLHNWHRQKQTCVKNQGSILISSFLVTPNQYIECWEVKYIQKFIEIFLAKCTTPYFKLTNAAKHESVRNFFRFIITLKLLNRFNVIFVIYKYDCNIAYTSE